MKKMKRKFVDIFQIHLYAILQKNILECKFIAPGNLKDMDLFENEFIFVQKTNFQIINRYSLQFHETLSEVVTFMIFRGSLIS